MPRYADAKEVACVGATQHFECQVIGFPMPTITWYKDDVNITYNSRYEIEHDERLGIVILLIRKVTKDDEGMYQCCAENAEGVATTSSYLVVKPERGFGFYDDLSALTTEKLSEEELSQIQILKLGRKTVIEEVITHVDEYEKEVIEEKSVAPKIKYSDILRKPIHLKAGGVLYLEVDIEGYPQPKVIWYLGENELSDSKKYQIELNREWCSLKVKAVTAEDAGKYRVTAENAAGIDIAEFTAIVKTVPGQPRNVEVVDISKTFAIVAWQPPLSDGGAAITGYQVEKCMSGGSFVSAGYARDLDLDFKVTKLYEGSEYLFRVRAENALGMGKPTETEKPVVAKLPFDPPDMPVDLHVTGVDKDRVSLAWKAPINTGGMSLCQYVVERRDVTRGAGVWIVAETVDPRNTECTVKKLFQGNSYEFRVFSENQVGIGKPAELGKPVVAKLPYDCPDAPCDLRATEASSNYIVLEWNPPKTDGGSVITSYILEKRDPKRHDYFFMAEVAPDIFKYKATKLFEGYLYSFRVLAENEVGASKPCELANPVKAKLPYDEPCEPRDLKVVDYWPDSITVSWQPPESDGGATITGYIVEKREANRKSWVKAATVPAEVNEFKACNLFDGGEYYFRVFAENCVGPSLSAATLSKPACAKLPYDPPSKPVNIVVTSYDVDYITLEWQAPETDGGSSVTRYVIESRDVAGRKYGQVGVVSGDTCKLKVEGLIRGESYVFRVAAENEVGRGEYRELEKPATAKLPYDPPSIPQNLHVSTTWIDHIDICWETPQSDGGSPITGYLIEQCNVTEGSGYRHLAVVGADKAEFRADNLVDGRQYQFRVFAQNAAGSSQKSAELPSAVTAAYPFDKPDAPSQVRVTKTGPGEIDLEWDAPQTDGGSPITRYKVDVRRTNTAPSAYSTVASVEPAAESIGCHLTGLVEGGEYYVRVCAENLAGVSETGAEVSEPVVAKTPIYKPEPPSAVRVTKTGPGEVDLEWDAPKYDGGSPITKYIVDVRRTNTSPDEYSNVLTVDTAKNDSLSCHLAALEDGGEYFVRVRAENLAGVSETGAEVSEPVVAKTPVVPPSIVREVSVGDITANAISLSWLEPENDGGAPLTAYVIEKSSESKPFEHAVTVDGTATSVMVGELTEGVEYQFRAFAQNEAGLSQSPALLETPVVPKAPIVPPSSARSVKVDKVKPDSIAITWKAPKSDGGAPVSGYIIQTNCPNVDNVYADALKVDGSTHEAVIGGLTEGTLYNVRVFAENEAGLSTESGQLKKGIETPLKLPPSPTNLRVMEVTSNSVTVCWEAPEVIPDDPPIQAYIVEKSNEPDGQYELAVTTDGSTCTATAEDLKVGESYYFRVFAKYEARLSKKALQLGEAIVPEPEIVIPEAPRNIHTTDVETTQACVCWDAPESDGGSTITKYIVEKRISNTEEFAVVAELDGDSRSVTLTDLEPGSSHDVRVSAENSIGRSETAGHLEAPLVLKMPTPPGPPGGVSVDAIEPRSFTITWEPPTMSGGLPVTQYIVVLREQSKNKFKKVGRTDGDTCTLSLTSHLEPEHEYYVRVYAENAVGIGGVAGELATPICTPATPPEEEPQTVPAPPSQLTVDEVGEDSLKISWSRSEDSSASYVISMRDSEKKKFKDVGRVDEGVTSFRVKKLKAGHAYHVRVFSENTIGLCENPAELDSPVMVGTPIEMKMSSERVSVLEGDCIQLTCQVTGRPTPSVVWTRGGRELTETDRVHLTADGDRYSIRLDDASAAEAGEYVCVANNGGKDVMCKVDVTVTEDAIDEQIMAHITSQIAAEQARLSDADITFPRHVMLASYTDTDKGVSLDGGDVVEVLDNENPNMWLVRKHDEHSKICYVPVELLEGALPYDSDDDDLEEKVYAIYVAVAAYHPDSTLEGHLPLEEGDRVQVLDWSRPDKWRCRQVSGGDSGWVPPSYITPEKDVGRGADTRTPQEQFRDEVIRISDPAQEAVMKRRYALKDMWESEREYIRDLRFTMDNYFLLFDRDSQPESLAGKKSVIFANFPEICSFHGEKFYDDLLACSNTPDSIGDVFLNNRAGFHSYISYAQNREEADRLLSLDASQEFLKELSANGTSADHKMALSSYLARPWHRIDEYVEMLRTFIKYSCRAKQDCTKLEEAVEMLIQLKHDADDLRAVKRIQGYDGDLDALGTVIMHDDFITRDGDSKGKDRHVFLFKDKVILTKLQKGEKPGDLPTYAFKQLIDLPDYLLALRAKDERAFSLHRVKPKERKLTFEANNGDTAEKWWTALSAVCGEYREVLPCFEHKLNNTEVLLGDGVQLDCHIVAMPTPKVSWYKDGKKIKPDQHVRMMADENDGYSLIISSVEEADMGSYLCKAVNSVGEETSAATIVITDLDERKKEKPASFSGKLHDVWVCAGNDAKLTCYACGYPQPDVKWSRNGEKIDTASSEQFTVTSSDGGEQSLLIKNVGDEVVGTYTCKAKNRVGSGKCKADVRIGVAPDLKRGLDDSIVVVEGERAEMSCHIGGLPVPDASWFCGSRQLKSGSNYELHSDDSGIYKLVIHHVTPADVGPYTCRAVNPLGVITSNTHISLPTPPTFTRCLTDTAVESGRQVELVCAIDARPTPDIVWLFRGVEMSVDDNYLWSSDNGTCKLVIYIARENNAGVYTCRVTNVAGSSECSAEVKVVQIPVVRRRFADVECLRNEPAEFVCQVDNITESDVTWYYNKRPIASTERVRLTRDATSCRLLIARTLPGDRGEYVCKISNAAGEATCSANLFIADEKFDETDSLDKTIAYLPKMVKKLRDQDAIAGDQVKFVCKVIGEPTPEVEWLKDGEPLSELDRIYTDLTSGTATLVITQVVGKDAGCYECLATNMAGESRSSACLLVDELAAKKVVEAAAPTESTPVIDFDQPTLKEEENKTILLSWKPASLPPNSKQTDINYIVERKDISFLNSAWEVVKSGIAEPTLRIDKYDPRKDYLYRVRAENEYGRSDPSMSVSYYGKSIHNNNNNTRAPPIIIISQPVDVDDGQSKRSRRDVRQVAPRAPQDKPHVFVVRDAVNVSWQAVSGDDIRYVLERRCPPSRNWIEVASGLEETEFVMTEYRAENDYMFRVRAMNQFGVSDASLATTLFAKVDLSTKTKKDDEYKSKVKPRTIWDKPEITVRNDGSHLVRWTASSLPSYAVPTPILYTVEQREPPNLEWVRIATKITDTELVVRKLSSGKDYYFRVRASNDYGTSEPSAPALLRRKEEENLEEKVEKKKKEKKEDEEEERPVPPHLRVPPKFISESSDTQYGVDGLKAKIVTKLSLPSGPGSNRAAVRPCATWYCGGEKLEMGDRYCCVLNAYGDLCLEIQHFTAADIGEYKVHVENKFGAVSQLINVDLADAPTFLEPLKDAIFHLRHPGRLECRVTGVPYPAVKFRKDFRPLVASQRVSVEREDRDHWTLNLSSAIRSDEGRYECYVENVAGCIHCFANVSVIEKANLWREIHFNQVSIEDHFHVIDELGRGSAGVMRRVIDKNTGSQYACKMLRFSEPLVKEEFRGELEVMATLDHPNIVQAIDGYEDKKRLAIVMEILTGGELLERLVREDSLTESDVAFYLQQVLLAVEYMHSKNVLHLDLKPENLQLLSATTDELKVIDFGYARRYHSQHKLYVKYCTPEYASPEVANGHAVTPEADLWSVGIIAYILISGISPFYCDTPRDTLLKVQSGDWQFDNEAFNTISKEAKDFITKLLIKDHKKRISASEALRHPFINLSNHRGLGDKINLQQHRAYLFRKKCQCGVAQVKTVVQPRPLSSLLSEEEASSMPAEPDLPPEGVLSPAGSTLEIGPAGMLQVIGPLSTASIAPSTADSSEFGREYEDEDTWYQFNAGAYDSGPDTHLLPTVNTSMSMRMAQYRRSGDRVHTEARPRPSMKERRDLRDLSRDEALLLTRPSVWQLRDVAADSDARTGFPPIFKEKLHDKAYDVGDSCTMPVHVIGKPRPVVTWYRNDESLTDGGRVRTTEAPPTDDGGHYSLTVLNTLPHDFGVYKCVARNRYGTVTCRARMLVGDIPSRPGRPHVTKVSDHEAHMLWEEPETDGNSYIIAYRVDWHRPDDERWTTATYSIDECALVKNLKAMTTYRFRVAAINKFGISPYSWASVEIKTKMPGCEPLAIDAETKKILLRSRQATTRPSPETSPVSSPFGSMEDLSQAAEQKKKGADGYGDREIEIQEVDPATFYEFGSEIWRGRFSLVRNVRLRNDVCGGGRAGARVAKVIPYSAAKHAECLREHEMLRAVRQQNIVRLRETFVFNECVILVLDKLYGENVARSLSQYRT